MAGTAENEILRQPARLIPTFYCQSSQLIHNWLFAITPRIFFPIMNSDIISSRSHTVACWLVFAVVIGLVTAPPLANLAELLLVIVMLSSSELRRRLWQTWQQPLVKWLLAFYAMILIGLLYSIAPSGTAGSMASGWRKLLLLPLALALFDDGRWKFRFLSAFTAAMAICAIASFIVLVLHIDVPIAAMEPGILLRNHATQGMVFAVAAFGAALMALEVTWRKYRPLFIAETILLIANVILVSTGRSGYLVLLICTLTGLIGWIFNKHRPGFKELALAGLAAILVVGALFVAPSSRERIALAIREVQQYNQATEVTSMGIRVIFWKNTIELIGERPLLGYGTGAFGEAYGHKVAGRTGVAGTPAGDPHNQYMKIAAEHGLIGLGIFACFLITALRGRVPGPWRIMNIGVLLGWCASSLANSHFSTFAEGSFIYAWIGIMLSGMNDTAEAENKAG